MPNAEYTNLTQWSISDSGAYTPVGSTVRTIASGAYNIKQTMSGYELQPHALITDEILILPGSPVNQAITSITSFWAVEDRYRALGMVYKRGIILYGPQGTGKTVAVNQIAELLIQREGIVIYADDPGALGEMLHRLRAVESTRPIVVILEELDGLIQYHGEREFLSLLDGENQINNVVYLATTNNPQEFPARFINRPGRFDERILVNPMGTQDRAAFLRKKHPDLAEADAQRMAKDTEGFSIAHLKELLLRVVALDQPYDQVLRDLRNMAIKPDEINGFAVAAA